MRPIWLLVAIFLALDVVMLPLVKWLDRGRFDDEIFMLLCVAGAIVGQCCFVVVISALARRTWFGGFLLGLLIATAGFFAICVGAWFNDDFRAELLAGIAAVPAFLLVSASPLFMIRHQFGWRIADRDHELPPRQPLSLGGMFSLMAVAAAVLVMWRAPQVVLEEDADDYWIPMAIFSAIAFGIGLIVVPICVRVGLGSHTRPRSILGLLAVAVAIVIMSFGISQCFFRLDESWDERMQVVPYLLGFLGGVLTMFYGSLYVISLSGLSLERQRPMKGAVSEPEHAELQRRRRDTRWRIVSAVIVTMMVSGYLAHLESWRAAKDAENTRLQNVARRTGGSISFRDRYGRSLRLGLEATDADFAEFIECDRLEYLYIGSPHITDSGMANLQYFSSLTTLSLKATRISNKGLKHLQHLSQLTSLTIQDTELNADGLIHISNKEHLETLSLFGSGFGDEQVELLTQFPNLSTLFLDKTKITDSGLSELAALKRLTHLQLTDTQVTAKNFPYIASLLVLYLDGSQVEDAGIAALIPLPKLNKLSVRDTQITNAAIRSVRKMPALSVFEASGTHIDDAGVAELQHAQMLTTLDLSDTSITGAGFRQWKSGRLSRLWLERTPLDDEGLKHLITLGPFRNLSLEGTAITDACLPTLVQVNARYLDVNQTKLTAKGILANPLPSVSQLTLGEEQLKSSERYDFQKKLGTHVSVKEQDAEE